MKKFLTVLLVIAVMFTFSFSTAFAAVPYSAEKTSQELYATSDYTGADYTGSPSTWNKLGGYGVTETAKENYIDLLDAAAYNAEYGDDFYPAPELEKLKAAVEAAKTAINAATTEKAVIDAYDTYFDSKTFYHLPEEGDVLGGYGNILTTGTSVEGGTLYFDTKLDAGEYALPGYGAIVVDANGYLGNNGNRIAAVKWLLDNGYCDYSTENSPATWLKNVAKSSVEKAFATAWEDYVTGASEDCVWTVYENNGSGFASLEDYGQDLYMELDDIIDDMTNFKSSTSIDDTIALYNRAVAFAKNYAPYTMLGGSVARADALVLDKAYIVNELGKVTYICQKWNRANVETIVTPIAKLNKKADVLAAKTDILGAADSLVALKDKYGDEDFFDEMMDGYSIYEQLNTIVDEDYAALVKKVDAFTELKTVGTDEKATAYFDASEANVAALATAREAFDAFKKDYAKVLDKASFLGATLTTAELSNIVALEAKILAGEHNKAAAAGYDEKNDKIDTSLVQAYLNNATVKVTTKALGNGRVRVQATIDTTSMKYMLDEMADGCTVSYKFYKNDKGYSWRTVNYTTFKGQKAGKKSYYQCAVEIKDADGKVVATKDYKASTVGVRTAK